MVVRPVVSQVEGDAVVGDRKYYIVISINQIGAEQKDEKDNHKDIGDALSELCCSTK